MTTKAIAAPAMTLDQIKDALHAEIVKHDQVTESEHVTFNTLLASSETNGQTWQVFARYSIRRTSGGFPIVGAVEAYVNAQAKVSCYWLTPRA